MWLNRQLHQKKPPADSDEAVRIVLDPHIDPADRGTPRVSVREHWENIADISETCRKQGIEVYLVIPACDPQRYPWPADRLAAYQNNFRRAATRFQATLIDLPSLLTSKSRNLFIDGLHWNDEGHQWVAECLAEGIKKNH
jgi:lysophospholipase L1-like esterase